MPVSSDAKATLPEWNLSNLHRESQQGAPPDPLTLLKYQMQTEELSMKVLAPKKKNTSQMPAQM